MGSITQDIKIDEPPLIPPEYAADLVKWKAKSEAHYCAVGPVSVTGESVGVETWTNVTGEAVGVGGQGITVFSLDNTPVIDESETIYVGGVAQTRDTDYAIDYTTGTITFISVLNDSSAVTADYEYMDIFVTLTALATNLGAKPVNVAITFAILETKWGLPAGPALIENVTLAAGETAPVSVELDTNDYGYTGTKITLYAHVTLEYYDADTETWIPTSTEKIIHFVVGP